MTDIDPIAHVRHLPIAEQMKYSFARYIWPRRNQPCPAMHMDKDGIKIRVTWAESFKLKYRQSLDDYVAFCKANYDNRPKPQE
jgi:hypothetical protein